MFGTVLRSTYLGTPAYRKSSERWIVEGVGAGVSVQEID